MDTLYSYSHAWSLGSLVNDTADAFCDVSSATADGKIVVNTDNGKLFFCYNKKENGELTSIFRAKITVVSGGSSDAKNFSGGKGLLFRLNGSESVIPVAEGETLTLDACPIANIEVIGTSGVFTVVGFY